MNTLQIEQLPDDVQELKKIIMGLNKKVDLLLEQVDFWKMKLYGSKSERFHDELQRLLFNEIEMGFDGNAIQGDKEPVLVQSHRRAKKGRRKLPEGLERKIIEIDVPEKEKVCGLGRMRKFIGWEISEKLDIKPPEVKVIQYKRAVYGCPDSSCVICEEGQESPVKTAVLPPQLLDKTVLTPGLFSFLITSKFCDHLPFYRMEKIFNRFQIDISRQTMCRWAIAVHEKYEKLLKLFWHEMLKGPVIGIDETTFQVIREKGRLAQTKSYMWVFRGGNPRAPTIITLYRETRSAKFLLELLKGYHGFIQTDGYKGYNDLEGLTAIILVACWAHARRKFEEANRISKNKGSAIEALTMIQKLYLVEKKAKDLTYKERKVLRQKESKPVLKTIKEWLDQKAVSVLPESLIGKAVFYALNLWPRLARYIEDGRIPIDNNGVENAIRPECLGKKNWLFAFTPSGANASCFYYSIIETAKANGLEPYWYLRYLFTNIVYVKTEDDLRNLLPQYIDKDKIQLYKLPEKWVL